MKVLMLGWELPPHNSGGLGVACYNLCRALAHRDVDLEFVLPYSSSEQPDFMKLTAALPVGVEHITQLGNAYDSYLYSFKDGHSEAHNIYEQQALYEMAVEQLIDQTEFDIIHAHDWLTFRAGLRAKQRSGCPLILHVHSVEFDRAGGKAMAGNPLVREIEGTAFLMADQILAVSDYTKQVIAREYHIPLSKIDVVHNSINADSIEPLDDANAYRYIESLKAQGYKVITNIGRLTIQKGLPNLLRSMQIVVNHEPNTLLLLVGNGDQFYELIELSAELGIAKNVIFTDFQRGKAWRDAFAIADLFVMPSVSEPFGLTPLEAASYGTPSLISKQSGVAELLKSSLKVDYWDVNEMASQMIGAIRSQALRDELLAGSQREISAISWHHSAAKVHQVYQRHLNSRRMAAIR